MTVLEEIKIETYLQWKANMKSYIIYQMAPIPIISMTLKVTVAAWNPSECHNSENTASRHVSESVYIRIGKHIYLAYNFKYRYHIESEGLLKVTGNHVRCENGNISETVQDREREVVGTTDHITNRKRNTGVYPIE